MDQTTEELEQQYLDKIIALKELYHDLDKLILSKYAGPLYSGPAIEPFLQKYRRAKHLIDGGNI